MIAACDDLPPPMFETPESASEPVVAVSGEEDRPVPLPACDDGTVSKLIAMLQTDLANAQAELPKAQARWSADYNAFAKGQTSLQSSQAQGILSNDKAVVENTQDTIAYDTSRIASLKTVKKCPPPVNNVEPPVTSPPVGSGDGPAPPYNAGVGQPGFTPPTLPQVSDDCCANEEDEAEMDALEADIKEIDQDIDEVEEHLAGLYGSVKPSGMAEFADELELQALYAERAKAEQELDFLDSLPPCGGFYYPGLRLPFYDPLQAVVLTGDYANIDPNLDKPENSWGVWGNIITTPLFGGNSQWDPSLEFGAGWHTSSSAGDTTTQWTVGGSAIWYMPNFRFGPAVGFQSSDSGGFEMRTLNYGGFAQWFATNRIDVFAKVGGFTMTPSPSGGWYAGGSANYYVTRDLAATGGIDYTRYNQYGGYNETDYTAQAEYLFSEKVPVSIYGGYSFSDYHYDSLPSFHYHSSKVFVGLRIYLNGDGVDTLEDRQRFGLPAPHQFKF